MNLTYQYNSSNITFKLGDGVMVNATEMAKPFGKQPKDWLRTDQANVLINTVSNRHICLPTDLVEVINGGNNFGTWMHEDVALFFAQWLSPEFYLWCNDRIKELLTKGYTSLDNAANLSKIRDHEATIKNQRFKLEAANELLEELVPKAKVYDKLFNTQGVLSMSEACKAMQLPYGRTTLFKELRKHGVIFQHSTEPKQTYINLGYFKLKETIIPRSDGSITVKTTPKVTQKGLTYLSKVLDAKVSINIKNLELQ